MRARISQRRMWGLVTWGLLFLGLAAFVGQAWGAAGTHFVAPWGSGNACSQAQPCTLATALSQAGSGDTVYVAMGAYTGSGGAVITLAQTITLYGGWDGSQSVPPVRDPRLYLSTLDGEEERRVVYIVGGAPTIDGFVITRGSGSYSGGGIASEHASPTIRDCEISDNEARGDGGAIFVNGGSAEIRDNRIISNTATWAGGLRIINNAQATIEGNEIRGNVATSSAGGIFVDCCGGSRPLIARNWIAQNDGGSRGGGVVVLSTQAALVNNIVAGNEADRGASVYLEGSVSYPVSVTLTHNTLAAGPAGGESLYVTGLATATLVNNISVGHTTGITLTAPAGGQLLADHNLFWNASDPLVGTNPVLADPLLDSSYHLTAGSPARDAGAPSGVTTDFDGDPRPVGGYDIGADEYLSGGVMRVYLPLVLREW